MPFDLQRVARAGVKTLSITCDLIARPDRGIVILIYHRVGSGSGGEMDLPLARFRAQLRYLRDTQRVLTLDAALDELAGPGPVRPGVVVTFDDGTADWSEHVAGALVDFEIPATFYVATRFVEEGEPFPHHGRPISWSGLAELRDSGLATIGSHTHTHSLLDRLEPAALDDELRRSDDLIGERLGIAVEHFCYPKAVAPSAAAAAAVQERYRSAVLAGTRANLSGADPLRLARSPIQASDRAHHVKAKIAGGMGAEDRLRDALNRRRYRHAST